MQALLLDAVSDLASASITLDAVTGKLWGMGVEDELAYGLSGNVAGVDDVLTAALGALRRIARDVPELEVAS